MRLLVASCLLLASIPAASQAQFAGPGERTGFSGFTGFNTLSDRPTISVGGNFGLSSGLLSSFPRQTAIGQPSGRPVVPPTVSSGGLNVPDDPRGEGIAERLVFPADAFQEFLGSFTLPEGVPMEGEGTTGGEGGTGVTNTSTP